MTATSIAEAFRGVAARFPERTAIIFLGEHYRYRQIDAWSDWLAGSLARRGVRRGDRAMIYAPHSPQWVIAWLALQKLGAVAVPVTHVHGPEDLRFVASDSGAETVFCGDTNFGHLDKVRAKTPLRRVIVTGVADLLPAWKRIAGHALDRIPRGKVSAGVLHLRDLLSERAAPPPVESAQADTAEMLYTGGTTAFPKGVPFSQALFLEACEQHLATARALIPEGENLILQGAPLYHILGQVFGLGALLCGEAIILLPKTNLDALFEHIERHRAKTVIGTPTLYRMLLEHDRVDQYDLGSLRYCFSGGDVLPVETGHRWKERTGQPLLQGYGATETCGGVAMARAGEELPAGAAGKVCAHQQVLVVDPETLEPVPAGEPGELLVSSGHMVSGYWNRPDETARHFLRLRDRLWYRTGDIVRIDQDGWFFFQDRSVDIIKHKGYRVAASKVDNALQEHQAVVAACTIGVPDVAVGERIKSFVVVKQGTRGVDGQALIRWCRERLAPYEVPQYIEFRDMLPKSKVGKILRRELRSDELRKAEAGPARG
jgi:long-chain acyl-CoA synthetase